MNVHTGVNGIRRGVMIVINQGYARQLTDDEWEQYQIALTTTLDNFGVELGRCHSRLPANGNPGDDEDPHANHLVIVGGQLFELRADRWIRYLEDHLAGRANPIYDYGVPAGPFACLPDVIAVASQID